MGELLVKKDATYWGVSLEDLRRRNLTATKFLGFLQELIILIELRPGVRWTIGLARCVGPTRRYSKRLSSLELWRCTEPEFTTSGIGERCLTLTTQTVILRTL